MRHVDEVGVGEAEQRVIALQALVLYAPPFNAMFHTVPLAPAVLLPIVALASSVLWVEELRKWGARRALAKAAAVVVRGR